MRLLSLAFVLSAAAMAPPAFAQLVVELPFDPGIPAREIRSREWVGPDLRAGRQDAPLPSSRQRVQAPEARPEVGPYLDAGSSSLSVSGSSSPAELSPPPPPPPAAPIVLSSFDGSAGDGGIRPGTTWVGNVSQGAGYLTIGGTARDDNGWGATGLTLNATGLTYLTLTAQRDAGHSAGSVFLQVEDRSLGTRIFSFDASLFAVGSPTQVQIVVGVWSGDIDFTQISGWNIGGGGVGTQDFRMTLHHVEFTTSAIPEPAAYAAIAGAAFLGLAILHRRKKKRLPRRSAGRSRVTREPAPQNQARVTPRGAHSKRHPLHVRLCRLSLRLAGLGILVFETLLRGADAPAVSPRISGTPFMHVWQTDEFGASPVNWRMVQHPNGLIYIANGFGVLEFDGASWRLTPMPDEAAARSLAIDKHGRVWAGGNGQIITLEPDAAGTLRAVDQTARLPAAERTAGALTGALAAEDGIFFSGDRRIFLFRYDGAVLVWRTEGNFSPLWTLDGHTFVTRDFRDVLQLRRDGGTQRVATSADPEAPLLRTHGARRIGNEIVLLTRDGLQRWSGEGAATQPLSEDGRLIFGSERTRTALLLPDGRYVFATGRGALVLNAAGQLEQRFNAASGLPVDSVNGLGQDRDGGLWVALQNGVARIQIDSPFALHGKPQGLESGPRRLVRWRDRLYVAHGSGVAWRDPITGRFHAVPGLSSAASRPIVVQDRLLVSTAGGVREIDYDGTVRTWSRNSSLGLIASERQPGWLLSGDSDGLWIMAPTPRSAARAAPGWRIEGRLRNLPANVVQLYDFNDGFVWVVGSQGEIWRIDFRAGLSTDAPCEAIGIERGVPPARRRDHVQLLRVGDRLFAASKGWLLAWDARQERFAPAAAEFGSSAAAVYAVVDERTVFVHVESPHSQFLRLTQAAPTGANAAPAWRAEPFSGPELDGLVFNSLFHDAPTNTLWIAAQGSLLSLDLAWRRRPESPPLRALIRRVVASDGGVIEGGATAARSLRLAAAQNALRFEFAAPAFSPDFRGRTLTRFRTRVDGLDADWSDWTLESYRDFTNLPYRDLVFRLQAMTPDGRVSAEATLPFSIAAPWWRTRWALGGYGLLALGSVSGLVLLRTRTLRRRAARLEEIVKARTAELGEKNATLATQNTELARLRQLETEEKIAARLAEEKAHLEVLRYQLNPHFLFNALTSVCAQLPASLPGARATIERITDFCQLTLFKPTDHEHPTLADEIKMLRAYLDIEQTRWGELLQVEIVLQPEVADERVPSLLLLPLVENALKYGRATHRGAMSLRLTAWRDDAGVMLLEVANTGEWVGEGGRGSVPSLGIGLENLRQRLRRHYPGAHEFTTVAKEGWVVVRLRLAGSSKSEVRSSS